MLHIGKMCILSPGREEIQSLCRNHNVGSSDELDSTFTDLLTLQVYFSSVSLLCFLFYCMKTAKGSRRQGRINRFVETII